MDDQKVKDIKNYLNSGFIELCTACQFFPAIDIRIMRFGESGLQFLKLLLKKYA